MTLAVLDWGIGGAGIYRMIKDESPTSSVIYVSDSGTTPYGKLPRRALATRLDRVFEYLAGLGATHVVLACNAASTVLGDLAPASRHGMEVVGVIEPTLAALRRRKANHFGVVGGVRTIRSCVYARSLRDAGHVVTQRVAQPLSAFVEAGELETKRVREAVERIVLPLARVDALVLACTHYPALAPLFTQVLPGVELVDPAGLTWAHVRRHWIGRHAGALVQNCEPDRVLTTGNARATASAAQRAFGVEWQKVRTIDLA